MQTYYADLKQQLKKLGDDTEQQCTLEMLKARKLSVGECVQRLFPHIGSKSQAALALIHIAELSGQPLNEEKLTNAMQDLLIAQHKAADAEKNSETPEAHIYEVKTWVQRLKGHGHITGKAGKLYSNV